MKNKKQLIVSQIIIAVSVIIASLIMLRPGSSFDITENWFVFYLIIIFPAISSAVIMTFAKDKKDKDNK